MEHLKGFDKSTRSCVDSIHRHYLLPLYIRITITIYYQYTYHYAHAHMRIRG